MPFWRSAPTVHRVIRARDSVRQWTRLSAGQHLSAVRLEEGDQRQTGRIFEDAVMGDQWAPQS